jgi:TetR/AcrR family transcriptional regulator of autoinduction and epiphytic fitness
MNNISADTTKRGDIISAAINEFRMRGFGGARVDDIAERAKVSKRTLYRYFPSKEILFDEIVKMALTPHPPGTDGSYDPDRTVAEQLVKLIDGYIAIVSEEHYMALARVVTVEFIQQPELAGALQKSAPEDRFLHFIGAAMKAGALRSADPGHAASQLSALLKAFFFWPGFFQALPPLSDDERMRLRDDCIAMFLKHYQPN